MEKKVFVGIYILVILLLLCYACNNSELSLHATVSFNKYDQQFYIHNIDSFSWYKAEMILNYEEDDLSSGYKYDLGWMYPGEWEFIHGLRFQNSEGKRYNPWLEKPVRLMILAETEDGKKGKFVKTW